MSMMEAIDKAIKERDWLRPEVERLQGKLEVAADGLLERDAEIERLKGMKPAPLSGVIPTGTLPRYMVRWNGPTEPLAVPSDDGYWTPWHVAQAEIKRQSAEIHQLKGDVAELTQERDQLRAEWRIQNACIADQHEDLARLNEVIDRAAKAWMSLEPQVAWEGDVADAMAAGVAEIEKLRALLTDSKRILEQGVRDYLALMGWHDRQHVLLREAVTRLLACPAIADVDHGDPQWGCAETREAEAFARAALAGKESNHE